MSEIGHMERDAAESTARVILELAVTTGGNAPMIDQLYDTADERGRKILWARVLSVAVAGVVNYAQAVDADPADVLDRTLGAG